jgi:hypothetical protein
MKQNTTPPTAPLFPPRAHRDTTLTADRRIYQAGRYRLIEAKSLYERDAHGHRRRTWLAMVFDPAAQCWEHCDRRHRHYHTRAAAEAAIRRHATH